MKDHYEALLPSNYLRWVDLDGRPALIEIDSVRQEEITIAGGTKKIAPVM